MFTKSFLQRTRTQLEREKEEITTRSNYRHDIDVDGDEIDEIQGNVIIEMQNQLQTRDRQKLSQIFDALQKMDNNEYGLCQDCGEEISEKRLAINPHFLTCISCAEDREVAEKQKKGF